MRWDRCPWAVPAVLVFYVALQLALGMTWDRFGKVRHTRRGDPRGYWLSLSAQAAAAALIVAFMTLL